MNNKMRIIVPSYNNAEWVKYNITSILSQTYENYEVIYIDDASTDDTIKLVTKYINGDSRFRIHRNDVNRGAMYNYFETGMEGLEDDTIVIHLDGDDWLIDIFVLEKLNNWYNKHDSWMTYGKMYVYRGELDVQESNPQNTPYPDYIHEHKLYRKDTWRASHMRTYRGFLLKAINKEDLIDSTTGEYYWEASDLSFQYPCLEMCPKEKIGVVDFPTYIYNAAPTQTIRTAARQQSNRHHEVEQEIRNKKHYKEGAFGVTLPQINFYGYEHSADYFPNNFSYVENKTKGEFDITQITDFEIPRYISGELQFNSGKVVADLYEGRFYSNMDEIYELVYDNYTMFDLILTHDPKLLELPNSKLRMIMDRHHLTNKIDMSMGTKIQDDSVCIIHPKTKNISCIASDKAFLPGHVRRLEFLTHIMNTDVKSLFDMYGKGFNEIGGKIDGLRDYRFSIAIENSYTPNWATEKISDCFLTGTIPIYYGCPNIGDYFDLNGIITFQTENELEDIIMNLHENGSSIYTEKMDSVQKNYELVWDYSLNPDQHFDKYLRKLIHV